MKIALTQKPIFYIEDKKLKASLKQGKDILEFLIETKPSFYKETLSAWENLQDKCRPLFNAEKKWVQISIKEGSSVKTAYLLKSVFEKQDFKQIVKKALKQKEKQVAQVSKKVEPQQKPAKAEVKAPIQETPLKTAPMLYALDRIKIDKATSFEDLRQIATKYLKLEKTSHDFEILQTIAKRLSELKKDPFGKQEKEVLHTLNVKYLNAEIPKLKISLKQIQEAMTPEMRQELLKKALNLPKDASFKMIQAAYNRHLKELGSSKDLLHTLSLNLLKELMNPQALQTETA
jgi:hypothetical protein